MLINFEINQQYRLHRGEEARVSLDGEDITAVCIQADTQCGNALCRTFQLDNEGRAVPVPMPPGSLVVARAHSDEILTYLRYGKIDIKFVSTGVIFDCWGDLTHESLPVGSLQNSAS